jgi:hypothetical protein
MITLLLFLFVVICNSAASANMRNNSNHLNLVIPSFQSNLTATNNTTDNVSSKVNNVADSPSQNAADESENHTIHIVLHFIIGMLSA